MSVIGGRDKGMKWLKMLMVFQPPFGLNMVYEGNFKGCNVGWKGVQPPHHPRNLGIRWPCPCNLVGRWENFPGYKTWYCECSWCQHAVELFCFPQLQWKEGEHCIWISPMKRFRVLVSKLLEVVLHVAKWERFGVLKVNGG